MPGSADALLIAPSDDLAASVALAKQAELEVASDQAPPLAMWGAFDGERMVGTVSLNDYKGLPIVGRIAVERSYRGQGLGRRLLAELEQEARRRALPTLWATARAPGFFVANGFAVVTQGAEQALLLSECADCHQRGKMCHPRAVRKELAPSTP